MKTVIKQIVLLGAVVGLSGCVGQDMNDLKNWTENLYRGQTPDVEPLPVIPPYSSFAYTASELADPFAPSNLEKKSDITGNLGGGPRPIDNRRREPLEQYPLDSITMMGTLHRDAESWVILKAPDDTIHRAREGNYLGQSHGIILGISEEKIDVRELIQGPNGNWMERNASVAINQ